MAITIEYTASMPRFNRFPYSGSLRATRKYAKPTKVAKMTTAIVDVVR